MFNQFRSEALDIDSVDRAGTSAGERAAKFEVVIIVTEGETGIDGRLATLAQDPAYDGNMRRQSPSLLAIFAYILSVILLTSMVIAAIYAITDSWVGGAAAGGISGASAVALYPVIFRTRTSSTRDHILEAARSEPSSVSAQQREH